MGTFCDVTCAEALILRLGRWVVGIDIAFSYFISFSCGRCGRQLTVLAYIPRLKMEKDNYDGTQVADATTDPEEARNRSVVPEPTNKLMAFYARKSECSEHYEDRIPLTSFQIHGLKSF